jgi:undecaprenyl-diphosphatase
MALTALVGLLAVAVSLHPKPFGLDTLAFRHLVPYEPNGSHASRDQYRLITTYGSFTAAGAAVLMSAWSALRRDLRGVGTGLGGPMVALVVYELALRLVDRATLGGQPTFPSGTSTAVAACCCAALLLVYRFGAPTVFVALAGTVLGALVAAVGIAVVGLQWHYATDTIAGILLGAAAVFVVAVAFSS